MRKDPRGHGTVTLTARHVDDTKVTEHHAIIPTEQRVDPVALSPDEKRLYDLIARRLHASMCFSRVNVSCAPWNRRQRLTVDTVVALGGQQGFR